MERKERVDGEGTGSLIVVTEGQAMPISSSLTNSVLAIICLVCCSCGVGAIVAQKWQARTVVRRCSDLSNPTCDPSHFQAPIWQTQVMFTAESICLVIWYLDRLLGSSVVKEGGAAPELPDRPDAPPKLLLKRQQVFAMIKPSSVGKSAQRNPPHAWLLWAIPAALDLLASTMTNVAFTLTFASTIQMMRSFCVIATAALSIFIIRKPLLVHQWLGIIGITLGMCVAALGAIANPEMETSSPSMHYTLLGILLAVVATTIQSLQLVLEEAILRQYSFDPLQAMGLQGVVGFILTLKVLWISHVIGFEDCRINAYQMMASSRLMVGNVIYLFTCFFLNSSGILLTQLGGAVLKGIIFSLRAPMLWLFELGLGWHHFDWPNLAGLIIIMACFILYSRGPSKRSKHSDRMLHQPVSCCCTVPYKQFQQNCAAANGPVDDRFCECGASSDPPVDVHIKRERHSGNSTHFQGDVNLRVASSDECVLPVNNIPLVLRASVEPPFSGEEMGAGGFQRLARAVTPPVWPIVAVTPPPARRACTPSRTRTCFKCESERYS